MRQAFAALTPGAFGSLHSSLDIDGHNLFLNSTSPAGNGSMQGADKRGGASAHESPLKIIMNECSFSQVRPILLFHFCISIRLNGFGSDCWTRPIPCLPDRLKPDPAVRKT